VSKKTLGRPSQGQWDFDFIVQLGRSFWPFRAYANADLGYRLRKKNGEVDRDPGDEFFWIAEFGYQWTKKLLTVIKYEGIEGQETTSLGLQLSGDVKKIQYISPAVLSQATDTGLVSWRSRLQRLEDTIPCLGPERFETGEKHSAPLT
jgi:hypothetical protein